MLLRSLNKIGIRGRKFFFHKRSFCIEKSPKYSDDKKLLRELCSKIRFRKVLLLTISNIFDNITHHPPRWPG